MKRFLLVTICLLMFSLPTGEVFAQSAPSVQGDAGLPYYYELPLCLPGMPADGSCLLYGPAQVIADMKASGIPYPPRALPAATPPSELGVMPVMVARINAPEDESVGIFASFEEAAAGQNPSRFLEPGSLRYVRFINNQKDSSGNDFVQLTTGEWMRAAPAAYPRFQGLEFFENPKNSFGWIIDTTESYVSPSFGAETTGVTHYTYDLIQVYDTVEAEGYFWYQIAPGEWVNSQKAKVVTLRTTPPEGVQANRWIELDLFQQTLMAYEDGQLVFATLMTSGRDPFFTRPGLFTIYEKKDLEVMRGSFEADRRDFYYLEAVPWQMFFDQARAIHTAYWRTQFGYEGSHGCVNLSPGDAQWLYQWADVGDYVWVHDTSGRTPTDPSLYGPGAP